mmetsp:Transcript_20517/g.57464  ORF Transcript_20517/g.57464 Transcript_20517/m.57464 type:complete len:247 (+) Transcript_20517:353-1093(+)
MTPGVVHGAEGVAKEVAEVLEQRLPGHSGRSLEHRLPQGPLLECELSPVAPDLRFQPLQPADLDLATRVQVERFEEEIFSPGVPLQHRQPRGELLVPERQLGAVLLERPALRPPVFLARVLQPEDHVPGALEVRAAPHPERVPQLGLLVANFPEGHLPEAVLVEVRPEVLGVPHEVGAGEALFELGDVDHTVHVDVEVPEPCLQRVALLLDQVAVEEFRGGADVQGAARAPRKGVKGARPCAPPLL